MTLKPAFEIGLLNAWILELYFLLPAIIFALPPFRKKGPANPNLSVLTKREKKITLISKIIMFFPAIYSIFLPFKLGTIWFYVGLPIALVGLIFYAAVWINLTAFTSVSRSKLDPLPL